MTRLLWLLACAITNTKRLFHATGMRIPLWNFVCAFSWCYADGFCVESGYQLSRIVELASRANTATCPRRHNVETRLESSLGRVESNVPTRTLPDAFTQPLVPQWPSAIKTRVFPCLMQYQHRLDQQSPSTHPRHRYLQGGLLPSATLFSPNRLIRLGITAWILAEVFSSIGLFEENYNNDLTVLGNNLKLQAQDVRARVEKWWHTARCPGGILHRSTWQEYDCKEAVSSRLGKLSCKHRFAIGTGVGLILSPAVFEVFTPLVKTSILLYAVAEVANVLVDEKSQNTIRQASKRLKVLEILDFLLTGLRLTVRNGLQNPKSVFQGIQSWFRDTNDGQQAVLPRDTTRGLIMGTIVSFIL